MRFENLTINSVDDIVSAFHKKEGGRIQDAAHSSWMLRYARVSDETRGMFAEAIVRLMDDIGGEDLYPTYELHEIMNLALLIGTSSHMPRLRKRLMEDVSKWSDKEIARFLSWISGSLGSLDIDLSTRQSKYSLKLTDEEIARVADLGAKPHCFVSAAYAIKECKPWWLAGFTHRNAQAEFDRGENMVGPLVGAFLARHTASYRLELIAAIQSGSAELQGAFRENAIRRGRSTLFRDVEAFVDKGFGSDHDRNHVYMQRIARIYRERVAYVKLALLLHPRDIDVGGQSNESLTQYAQEIQAGAGLVVDRPEEKARVVKVLEPVPLEGSVCTEDFEVAWVPMQIKRGDQIVDDRVLVYRIGNRMKVGLLVPKMRGS